MAEYRLPMKMVQTASIIVEAENEDEAADKVKVPRSDEIKEKLANADWRFEDYKTDFTWGIEAISE